MTDYSVIINPAAGGGAGARNAPHIERLLVERGLQYSVAQTEYPGHAAELAERMAGEGCRVVVAVGGDGTANEVLNGLMTALLAGNEMPALGILGVGRGNDFGHAVSVPRDIATAVAVLAKDHRRTIDVGRVTGGSLPQGRYFGNCVGVGFDAIGTIEANRLPRMGGFLTYLVAVLRTIFLYYRAPLTRIEYDGHVVTQPSLMVSVMNGRRLGGGFLMAPEGRVDDGVFDLCIAGEVSRPRMFALIPHFLRGTQATQRAITAVRASRVSITALEGSLPAQIDGEILCVAGQRLDIELFPRQATVVCRQGEGVA